MDWKKNFLHNPNTQNRQFKGFSEYQSMRTGYLTVLIHTTLERLGVFEKLQKARSPMQIEELSGALKIETDLLRCCIDFLYSSTDYLEKTEKGIFLKQNAPTWFWIAAYKPVFDNLEYLLSETKKYGKNIVRDGHYLQKLSVTVGRSVEDYIVKQLQETQKKTIFIDLGCGPGTLLVKAVNTNSLIKCIGIDIDPIITSAAEKNTKNFGEKIKIITADAEKIFDWKKHIPLNINLVFSANTILHELLRSGEKNFVSYLQSLKKEFPKSRFFIAEVDALSPDNIKNEKKENYKAFMAMYMLIHPLTDQGIPRPKKDWLSFFKKAGWSVTKTEKPREADTRIIYDCVL